VGVSPARHGVPLAVVAAALLRSGARLTSGLFANGVVVIHAVLDRAALIFAKQRERPAQWPVARRRATACAAGAASTGS
jgi:hypothetical protein